MKKIISFVLTLAVIAAGVYFVPKLVHTCDDCEEFFVGPGYEPNLFSDLITDEDQIICKECAEKQHAVEIALGKSVDDYMIDIFEDLGLNEEK